MQPLAGSSPRVRGTLLWLLLRGYRRRFIPARAGNAHEGALHRVVEPVHPRACGEHELIEHPGVACSGSSPRVRGTRLTVATWGGSSRFIPARAGNAVSPTSAPRRVSVHPRACGERMAGGLMVAAVTGSSPRVRGTRGTCGPPGRMARFIPARAGNAPGPTPRSPAPTVHPRACGERCHAD